jgi:hypothetical protein
MSTAPVKISPAEERFANSAHEGKVNLPEGVRWSLRGSEGNPPYLYASCSYCQQTCDTESADPEKAVFRHCNVATENSMDGESRPPKELLERLVKLQIQRGYRRAPSLMQRVTGEVPALVKIF